MARLIRHDADQPYRIDPQDKPVFVCACGLSQDLPFCDGSHKGTRFRPHVFAAESSEKKWLCMCKHTKNVPYCDGTHKTVDQPVG